MIALILTLAIALTIAVFAFRKSNDAPKAETARHPRKPKPKNRIERSSDWIVYHITGDQGRAAPDWAALPDITVLNIAGTSYRQDACDTFYSNMKQDAARVTLEWQSDREPPGLMVYAHADETAAGHHVGFIPAETSETIRNTYARDMPIGARLRRVGYNRDKDAYFLAIILVGPPKKRRDPFVIQDQKSEQ